MSLTLTRPQTPTSAAGSSPAEALVSAEAPVSVETPATPQTPDNPQSPATGGMNRRLGIIAILVSAAAMGMAGLFGRMSTPDGAVIGEALTLGRMLTGALGMFLLLAARGRVGLLVRTRMSWSVALGGILLGLSLATYLSATVLTSLSVAVVLHLLGPALATLLARIILKERPNRVALTSLLASIAGMVLASGPADGLAGSGGSTTGLVLGALSGVLYGAALLCYRYRADMAADVRSFWNFAFGSLATVVTVAVTRPDLSAMTGANWAWALAFFLVCGLLALGLLVVAGKNLCSAELSALSYVEVVVAVLVGAVVFHEAIGVATTVGLLLIALGAVVPFVLGSGRTHP